MALFLTRASGWASKQILENIRGNKVIKTVVHYILFFWWESCVNFSWQKSYFWKYLYLFTPEQTAFGSLQMGFGFVLTVPLAPMSS